MTDTKWLEQRYQTWYAVMEVKPSLRSLVGKKRLLKSLETRDLREAQQRRHGILAQWRAELKALEASATDGNSELVVNALAWRKKWLESDDHLPVIPDTMTTERDVMEVVISDRADAILELRGPEAASEFYRIATSESPLVSILKDTWIEEETQQFTEQHRRDCKRAFTEFLAWAGQGVVVGAVDRKMAGKYVSEVLGKTDRDRKTINKYIGCLSMAWKWMARRGHADDNPWLGQSFRVETKRGVKDDSNVALSQNDIKALLTTRRSSIYDQAMSDLIRIALLTGARQNELASLTVDQCEVDPKTKEITIEITEGKRKSSLRKVPIHSAIAPILLRRIEGAVEGKLFHELKPRGVDKKVGQCVSREFQELKKKIGLPNGKSFHSFRRNVMEVLEREGVAPSTVKLIVGHERGDMTFGVYSKGLLVDIRAAVEKIDYGTEVMGLIKKA